MSKLFCLVILSCLAFACIPVDESDDGERTDEDSVVNEPTDTATESDASSEDTGTGDAPVGTDDPVNTGGESDTEYLVSDYAACIYLAGSLDSIQDKCSVDTDAVYASCDSCDTTAKINNNLDIAVCGASVTVDDACTQINFTDVICDTIPLKTCNFWAPSEPDTDTDTGYTVTDYMACVELTYALETLSDKCTVDLDSAFSACDTCDFLNGTSNSLDVTQCASSITVDAACTQVLYMDPACKSVPITSCGFWL